MICCTEKLIFNNVLQNESTKKSLFCFMLMLTERTSSDSINSLIDADNLSGPIFIIILPFCIPCLLVEEPNFQVQKGMNLTMKTIEHLWYIRCKVIYVCKLYQMRSRMNRHHNGIMFQHLTSWHDHVSRDSEVSRPGNDLSK